MPILDPVKRVKVRQLGLNPDDYDEPDDTSTIPTEEANSAVLKPTPNVTSISGVIARSAARELTPTAAGLATMAATSELSPLVSIPAGIIAGIGTKWLQNKAIEKVLPQKLSDAYNQSEQQDITEHPYAASVGGLAASLPFLNLGADNLALAGKQLIPNEVNLGTSALKSVGQNVALQGALNYAVPAIQQKTLTPNIDPGSFLISTLGGALLNNSTKLGQRIGLEPVDIARNPVVERDASLINAQKGSSPTIDTDVNRQLQAEIENDPVNIAKQKAIQEQLQLEQEKEAKRLFDAEMEGQNVDRDRAIIEKQKQIELDQKNKTTSEQRAQDFNRAKVEESVAELNQQKPDLTIPAKDNIPNAEIAQKEKQEYLNKNYTDNLETDALLNQKAPQTEAERIQEEYDLGKRSQESSSIQQNLESKGITSNPTKEWAEKFKKLGLIRNVEVNDDGSVVGANGQRIAGNSFIKEGLNRAVANIDVNKGKIDTYPHELLHNYYQFLKTSGSPKEKALIIKGEQTIGDSQVFKDWVKSLPEDSSYHKLDTSGKIEEYLTTHGGLDTVRRVLGTDNKGAFKSWLGDFWSSVKHKMGKATPEDYARILSNKLVNDRPIEGNTVNNVTALPTKRSQENSPLEATASQLTPTSTAIPNVSVPAALTSAGVSTPAAVKVNKTPFEFNLGKMRPEVEKVEKVSPKVGEAFRNYYDNVTFKRGQFVNKFANEARNIMDIDGVIKGILKHPLDYLKQDSQEARNVWEYRAAKQYGTTLPTLTPNEVKLNDAITRSNREVRMYAQKNNIGRGTTGFNDDYLANVINSKALQKILDNPESPEALVLKKEFIDYQSNIVGAKEAQDNLQNLLDSYTSKLETNTSESFGPIDKAAGVGLPRSWRDTNLLDTQTKYLDRVARRFAYAEAIEKPAGIVGEINKFRTNDSVNTVYRDIAGHRYYDDPTINNIAGIVRSTMMGPLTGARDFTSNLTLGFQHHENPIQAVKNTIKAWGDMKQNISDGFETGRLRTHMNSLELNNGMDDFISVLKRGRDILSSVTGRNWFDQMARATSFGQARWTTLDFLEQQVNGKLSSQGKRWFDTFGKDTNWKTGNLTPEEVKRISARYVDSTQGMYDYRGLPKMAMEGSLSPVLSLARWNIEKSNNFVQHVVNPLLNGDVKPALMATIGTIAGAALVTAITEAITQRKQKTPTIGEIKESGAEGNSTIMPTFYKLAGLASAAGNVGMMGDLFKSILDVTYGKNRPQVYNNVMLEAADNVAMTTGSMIAAIHEDGFDPNIILKGVEQILEDNFQAYRLGMAYVSADKKEDIERANKFRDLRVFNTLSGDTIADQTSPFHVSLEDLKTKEFKKAKDISEAATILPELISNAMEKSNGDPEKLKGELEKIKKNSYQTMPSPAKMPRSFLNYVTFLRNTQGEEEANKRLIDYFQVSNINKAKSSMVP